MTGPEGAAMAHHLATCDECRARLEQESAIRERARSVLASADRALPEAPPFADLVAQARSVGLDAEGESFRLSALRGKPVLLKFFRGHW